jgi:hypothetical protein
MRSSINQQGFLAPQPPQVQPGVWLHFLALTILIVGIAFGMFHCNSAMSQMSEAFQHFQAPGTHEFTLTEGEIFSVRYEIADSTQVSSTDVVRARENVQMTLVHSATGESAPLIEEQYQASSSRWRHESPSKVFEVQHTGPHVVTVAFADGASGPPLVCAAIAFKPLSLISNILIGFGVTVVAFIVALLIFILTIIARSRSKRRIREMAAQG